MRAVLLYCALTHAEELRGTPHPRWGAQHTEAPHRSFIIIIIIIIEVSRLGTRRHGTRTQLQFRKGTAITCSSRCQTLLYTLYTQTHHAFETLYSVYKSA